MSTDLKLMKNESKSNTCFFCEGSEELKPFKNFFICQSCIAAAGEVNEKEE